MKAIRCGILSAAVLVLSAAGVSYADVVPMGVVDVSGTGFGAVNTILTFQGTGQGVGLPESGCVGVSSTGALNTTGSSVCQGGNVGGNELSPAGFPHNQTFQVSNASQIGLVFNADQPAGGTITLTNLTVSLYNSSGAVGFTSGPFSPVTLNPTQPGIGNSGFLFGLNGTQAGAAQIAINSGFDLLGLSATANPAAGGPETFFLTRVPEPGTFSSVGIGLIMLCLAAYMTRRQRPGGIEN